MQRVNVVGLMLIIFGTNLDLLIYLFIFCNITKIIATFFLLID